MPISAYIIRYSPGDCAAVVRRLHAEPGVEVGEPTDSGVPVAVDTSTARAAEEAGDRLLRLEGVKAATLVYHNFEDIMDPEAIGEGV